MRSIIETLREMLMRMEIFVLVIFFRSLVNGTGYFNDDISLLWFVS